MLCFRTSFLQVIINVRCCKIYWRSSHYPCKLYLFGILPALGKSPPDASIYKNSLSEIDYFSKQEAFSERRFWITFGMSRMQAEIQEPSSVDCGEGSGTVRCRRIVPLTKCSLKTPVHGCRTSVRMKSELQVPMKVP